MLLFFFIQPPSGSLRFLSHKQTQLTNSSVVCDRTWQTRAHRPNPVHHLFLSTQELRMVFTSLKVFLRNIKKRVIFYDTWKLWHSNFNVHKQGFIGSMFVQYFQKFIEMVIVICLWNTFMAAFCYDGRVE